MCKVYGKTQAESFIKLSKRKRRRCAGIAALVAVILAVIFQLFVRPEIEVMRCTSKIKGLSLAFHGYHNKHGAFPPAYTVDAEGRRLHSWRTLLLPYLGDEERELYGKIRLDEPWDSDHNRQFRDQPWFNWEEGACNSCCPTLRRTLPAGKNKGQYTNYMVVEGPGLVFDGPSCTKLEALERGTSNTVLFVESTMAVHWMCPVDIQIDMVRQGIVPKRSRIFGIGSGHPKGAVGFCLVDGSVHFETPETMPKELLPELFRTQGTASYPW